ncbi:MAG: thiosulfate oxidation carrier protein SoxY [Alphaproteobacteria bacterium]|nr:thiosulfate oxidation carrier protein SoxY [Alphaproteobacteria bacterium]MBF0129030.1 thiosulfate oxidation carrier protein SoxY [Alphaproteobacteria bacterium]
MSNNENERRLSRRDLLVAAGTGLVAVAGIALAPRAALAAEGEADKLMADLIGATKPAEGKITLTIPELAENGGAVPVGISVESPMTDKDYVKAIHIISEGNPTPNVASYTLSPACGKASINMRMRMAKSQKVRVVAVMSDGSAYIARKDVKVTTGGCG